MIESMSNRHVCGMPSFRRKVSTSGEGELPLLILCISICFQNVTLFALGEAGIKPYHIITFAILIVSFFVRKSAWGFPDKLLLLASLLLMIISMINAFLFKLSAVTFNYVFFFLIIVTAYNFGYRLSEEGWTRLAQRAGYATLIVIACNMLINSSAIINFYSNPWSGHPALPSVFGGGVNLDASWLALFGVFFSRNTPGSIFLLGSLCVSVLLASRSGMIICLLSIIYVYIVRPRNVGLLKKTMWVVLCALVIGLFLVNYGDVVLDRFLAIGEEPGSQGRMDMWRFAPDAFASSPLIGYGAGNAVSGLEHVSGLEYSEGNIHNYFLQVLLDFGIMGFIPFALLVAKLLTFAARDGFQNRFAIYIICWLIGSFLQFRGADAMLGFFVGAFFAVVRRNELPTLQMVVGQLSRRMECVCES